MQVDVVGSVNVDWVLRVADLPAPGETVMAAAATRLPGGKGANQAAAAARMGVATRLLGAVGDDEAGQWMRGQLAAVGVDVAGLAAVPGWPTGAAHIAVDARGENQIIVVPGANGALGPVVPEAGVVLAQNEVPAASVASAFAAAGE
ncbi:MAG TPA: PfkB family carbohydrate kinase, partial [Novosphingobium sp.]|nr:PfkB family carbohydrate kinase [Novosphingobium sp.]